MKLEFDQETLIVALFSAIVTFVIFLATYTTLCLMGICISTRVDSELSCNNNNVSSASRQVYSLERAVINNEAADDDSNRSHSVESGFIDEVGVKNDDGDEKCGSLLSANSDNNGSSNCA